MTDNEQVEQDIKMIIHSILHYSYEMDSNDAGDVANKVYDSIWEYIKDFD